MAAVTEAACLRRRARLLELVILSSGSPPPPVYSSEMAALGPGGVVASLSYCTNSRSSSPGWESELTQLHADTKKLRQKIIFGTVSEFTVGARVHVHSHVLAPLSHCFQPLRWGVEPKHELAPSGQE